MAEAEGEAEEATSHALVTDDEETSRKFKQLAHSIRKFRERLQDKPVSPSEGIREIRELRHFFESFNEDYDVSKCKACGSAEEYLKELGGSGEPEDLEAEHADHILARLAQEHSVTKPKLRFLDQCPKPNPEAYGAYVGYDDGTDEIQVCHKGVSEHLLRHEFFHFKQHLEGKPLDEEEAERFALEPTVKAYHVSEHPTSDQSWSWKTVAETYAFINFGKLAVTVFDRLDTATGRAGLAPQHRPSTWLTVGASVGLPLAAYALKLRQPWSSMAVLIGGFLSTQLWDILAEAATVMNEGKYARASWVPVGRQPTVATPPQSGEAVGKY